MRGAHAGATLPSFAPFGLPGFAGAPRAATTRLRSDPSARANPSRPDAFDATCVNRGLRRPLGASYL